MVGGKGFVIRCLLGLWGVFLGAPCVSFRGGISCAGYEVWRYVWRVWALAFLYLFSDLPCLVCFAISSVRCFIATFGAVSCSGVGVSSGRFCWLHG